MRRVAVSAAIPLLIALLLAPPAWARLKWCRTDPIVTLGGARVQILASVPEEYVPLVDGPVRVDIRTPRGVARELVYTAPGFNGHGEAVAFSDLPGRSGGDGFPAQVRVSVPIDDSRLDGRQSVPVQVVVIPDGGRTKVTRGTHRRSTVGLSIAPADRWIRTRALASLGGTGVGIEVAIPARYSRLVSGPTRVTIRTSGSVARGVISGGPVSVGAARRSPSPTAEGIRRAGGSRLRSR